MVERVIHNVHSIVRKPPVKPIRLPLIISRKNKAVMGIIFGALCTFLYMSSNHFHIVPPQLLPMSPVDRAVPFIPQTVFIYLSEYFLFYSTFAFLKDIEHTNRYVYSFITLQAVSVVIFWIWPTTFPRDLFPLPENLDSFTKLAFSSLRSTDDPSNCLPSLHVSSCYLSALMFQKEQRKKFPIYFLWATLIGASTLTTKQHYLIDVITGLAMAITFHWIFDTFVTFRENDDGKGGGKKPHHEGLHRTPQHKSQGHQANV